MLLIILNNRFDSKRFEMAYNKMISFNLGGDHMGRSRFTVNIDKDLAEIIPPFMENRKKDIVDLKNAISTSDFDTMKVIGHKLAGNAGSYGFDELGNYGAKLEEASISKNKNVCQEQALLIEDYLANVDIKFS
jgi:HPt (histidine-containing phosphotransfer) domain-containing protein